MRTVQRSGLRVGLLVPFFLVGLLSFLTPFRAAGELTEVRSTIPSDVSLQKAGRSVHKPPLVRNQGLRGPATTKAVCSSSLILTPGVPFHGDTTGQGNDFSGTDYPGLSWGEYGPDVVHQVIVDNTCDLRIHIAVDPVTYPDLDVILIDGTSGSCDTANWFWAGDDTIIYADCPKGVYYIIVDGYTANDFGAYILTVATAAGLLLVDDDGSGDSTQCTSGCPDVRTHYTNAVQAMTTPPSWSVWDVATSGSPSAQTLLNAKYVLWFCGAAFNDGKTITPENEQLLADYLDLGGRLMLVGQDILWDVKQGLDGRLPDGSLFNDYLQVNEVYQDVWTTSSAAFSVHGTVGNPIGDLLNCNDSIYFIDQVTTGSGAPFIAYTDSLITRFGDPVYYNSYRAGDTQSQKSVAIRHAASLGVIDYFKTIFFAFAPECNTPASVTTYLTLLIEETLLWFDEHESTLCGDVFATAGYFDDSALGNNNGMPDPDETFDFIVDIENSDTIAHNLKVYVSFEDFYVTRNTPHCVDLGSVAGNGGIASATFRMKMLATTPIGYRVRPEFNVVLADSGERVCFRAGYGAFVGNADVMLVKDEYWIPNTTGVDMYDTTLKTLGYSVAQWDTSLFGSPTYDSIGLSNDRMIAYPYVVWFTGYDFWYTLTPDPYDQLLGINPEAELSDYLDYRYVDSGNTDPARLILSSQDYFWEKYNGESGLVPSGDFAATHLSVNFVTQDFLRDATSMLKGIDGVWPAERMNMGLVTLDDGGLFRSYADSITGTFTEAGTSYMWSYFQPGSYAAISNLRKDRTSKFVFMPFAFENVQDVTPGGFPSKQRFLERLLCQMAMTPTDATPSCGYSLPACMTDVTLSVLKTDTSAFLQWAETSFTNQAAEPIFGRFRVGGSLNNPNPAFFSVLQTTATTFYEMVETVSAGQCFYYQISDYVDDFDQAASVCP